MDNGNPNCAELDERRNRLEARARMEAEGTDNGPLSVEQAVAVQNADRKLIIAMKERSFRDAVLRWAASNPIEVSVKCDQMREAGGFRGQQITTAEDPLPPVGKARASDPEFGAAAASEVFPSADAEGEFRAIHRWAQRNPAKFQQIADYMARQKLLPWANRSLAIKRNTGHTKFMCAVCNQWSDRARTPFEICTDDSYDHVCHACAVNVDPQLAAMLDAWELIEEARFESHDARCQAAAQELADGRPF
jgi:hypothetical protein